MAGNATDAPADVEIIAYIAGRRPRSPNGRGEEAR